MFDEPPHVVSTGYIVKKTGFSRMHVSRLAKANEIPGAHRKNEDSHWRFFLNPRLKMWLNVTITRKWARKKEPRSKGGSRVHPIPGDVKFGPRRGSGFHLTMMESYFCRWLAALEREGRVAGEPPQYVRLEHMKMFQHICDEYGYKLQPPSPTKERS